MKFTIHDISELRKAVEKLLIFANNKKKIAFYGEIGAGKTTFIQSFCKHMGVEEQVTSPTFALIQEYYYFDKNKREQIIHHIDLYRLNSQEEAVNIGIEDFLYDENYCMIEWPEIIKELLPEDIIQVKIEALPDSSREIEFIEGVL